MLIIRKVLTVLFVNLMILSWTAPAAAKESAGVVKTASTPKGKYESIMTSKKLSKYFPRDPRSSRKYARILVSPKQYRCLNKLWSQESRWIHTSKNSDSGAYGIPQALPGNKMASAGKDWRTNPATQIRWGIKYMKVRYGSPCEALQFHDVHGWY